MCPCTADEEDADDEQKDTLYEKLQNEFVKIPRYDLKIVLCNFKI